MLLTIFKIYLKVSFANSSI